MKKLLNILLVLSLYNLSFNTNTVSAQTAKLYNGGGVLKGTYIKIADALSASANGDSIVLSQHTFYENGLSNGLPLSKYNILQGTISGVDTTKINTLGKTGFHGFRGTIRDMVITGTDTLSDNGSAIEFFEGRISGNVILRNNISRNYVFHNNIEDLLIDGNLTVVNNYARTLAPVSFQRKVIVTGKLTISGNKSGNAGAILLSGGGPSSDTLDFMNINKTILDGNVLIENNEGISTGGIYIRYGHYLYMNGCSILNNKNTSGGSGTAILTDNTGNIAPLLRIRNSRFYNPLPDGSRQTEIYLRKTTGTSPKACYFYSDGCWWGESDTTGLIKRDPDTYFSFSNWAVTNWFCSPMGTSSTKVMSVMRLNTGAALPPNSLKGLEGSFFATAGTFSVPTSTITSANVVAGDYTYPSSGTFAVTAVIDADTFRPTTKMLGIKEQGFEQVKIYPNPAKDVINLSGVEEGSLITVYSIQGAVVSSQVSGNSGQVTVMDVSKLAAGNYILKIKNKDGGEGSAKIIVE
ncbi:MAG: T9SS type A sorting domain-containing protein [Chitinophagaceae bacterium]|jgi:hypothetical protein